MLVSLENECMYFTKFECLLFNIFTFNYCHLIKKYYLIHNKNNFEQMLDFLDKKYYLTIFIIQQLKAYIFLPPPKKKQKYFKIKMSVNSIYFQVKKKK